jgi:hypothetical protein
MMLGIAHLHSHGLVHAETNQTRCSSMGSGFAESAGSFNINCENEDVAHRYAAKVAMLNQTLLACIAGFGVQV